MVPSLLHLSIHEIVKNSRWEESIVLNQLEAVVEGVQLDGIEDLCHILDKTFDLKLEVGFRNWDKISTVFAFLAIVKLHIDYFTLKDYWLKCCG
jgi:hypothetical protein